MMQTDNQLIRKIKRKQNRQAADELLGRYYREIYAYAYRQTGEQELAMDLTQEIFVAVIRGIPSFDERKAQFRTWLYHVASNKITDYYRSCQHKMKLLEEEFSSDLEETVEMFTPDLADQMFQKERIGRIMEVVSGYDSVWVRIFQKKCFEGKKFAKIAQELQLPENTVKTRFYSMIKRLKKEMADYE